MLISGKSLENFPSLSHLVEQGIAVPKLNQQVTPPCDYLQDQWERASQ